jgi:hypothetical protein
MEDFGMQFQRKTELFEAQPIELPVTFVLVTVRAGLQW